MLAINFRTGDVLFVVDERLYSALSHMNIVSQSQCSYGLESSDEWISYGLAGFSFDLPVFASRSQIPSVCGYEPKLIVLG